MAGDRETGKGQRNEHVRFRALVLTALLTSGGFLVVTLACKPSIFLVAFSDAGLTLASAAAGVLCWRRGKTAAAPSSRWSWRLFGCSYFAFAAAMVYWCVAQLVFHIDMPYPSVADAAFLASIPLAGVALLLWPTAPSQFKGRLRTSLDGIVIAASAYLIAWVFVLGPLYWRGSQPTLNKVIGLAYPSGYVAVSAILVFVGARQPTGRDGPYMLLGGSILALAAVNMPYALMIMDGTYFTGHAIDTLWFVAFWFAILAAIVPKAAPKTVAKKLRRRALFLGLPHLPALAAGLATWYALGAKPGRVDSVLGWNLFVVVAALALRQYLVILELDELSRSLDEKVDRRSQALKRSQDALLRAQRLQIIAGLAAGVAHDFNNLLTIIGTLAQRLRAMNLNPKGTECVDELQRTTDRAVHLTRQLLAAGRGQVLHNVVFDLNPLVLRSSTFLGPLLPEAITLQIDVSSKSTWICADPSQMEQVLLNLVVNARDAMPRGGRIRICTDLRDNRDRVVLVVADEGIGMDAATMEQIFDPLYTTKEAGTGTGLGLATVWGIVTQSGGDVDVRSVVGAGSTFLVSFAAALAPEQETNEAPVDSPLRRQVLVLDHESDSSSLIRAVLDSQGHDALVASSGNMARQLLVALDRVDLVVSEVTLPEETVETTLQLVNDLRARFPSVPVLFISNFSFDDVIKRLPSESVLLQKPFSERAIGIHLRTMLRAAHGA
ncbi:MAG: ATP-binding protein [Myxococcales bacterium]